MASCILVARAGDIAATAVVVLSLRMPQLRDKADDEQAAIVLAEMRAAAVQGGLRSYEVLSR